jgi:hypothetical protein
MRGRKEESTGRMDVQDGSKEGRKEGGAGRKEGR